MSNIQAPPTYAEVVVIDPAGKKSPRFNPIWLKWFLDIVETMNRGGGTTPGTVTNVATGTGLTGGPISSTGTVALTTPVSIANGGTGATALANHGAVVAGASALTVIAPGTSGNLLKSNGTDWTSAAPSTNGTVTSVSVATANGFSGTVANATTTPAITVIAGALTPTSVNFGQTTLNNFTETTYTPVLATSIGTVTSYTSSGSYSRVGNRYIGELQVVVTNAGTGAGLITVTLPDTAGADCTAVGRETNVTGTTFVGTIYSGNNYMGLFTYANASLIATDYIWTMSFSFKV